MDIDRLNIENLSNDFEEIFTNTYSSFQIILSQMQIKLANVFLQEIQYLEKCEKQLEENENIFQQNLKSLKIIEIERQQLENDFRQIQNRLESAIVHVIHFQSNGIETLRLLFNESHRIDEEISGLISQCLSSLNHCRTMINSNIQLFSHRFNEIQLNLIEHEQSIHNTKIFIEKFFEFIHQLNQINFEHFEEINTININFDKQYQPLKTNEIDELTNIHYLEKTKQQLEKELLEQTILLENISMIIGKAID